jgi:hypothetical protein
MSATDKAWAQVQTTPEYAAFVAARAAADEAWAAAQTTSEWSAWVVSRTTEREAKKEQRK